MTALVTGASGFIGSHLVESLIKRGVSVRCFIRKSSNLRWLEGLPVELAQGDFFSPDTLEPALNGVEYVYHAAGLTKARKKEDYFRANHDVTRNLLLATRKFNPDLRRFVHISSLACVGPSLDGRPVDEQSAFHPVSTYGRSKMEAELECRRMMESLPITILRPGAVYGPRDTGVYVFFRTVERGILPTIGQNDRLVSLVHVRDVVQATILAAETDCARGQTYFASSESSYRWAEVGKVAAVVMGKSIVRIPIPKALVYVVALFGELAAMLSDKPALINLDKAKEIVAAEWTCSVEKARRELGFKQTVGLDEGIRDTVAWYRKMHWLR